eukprot:342948_1
MFTSPFNIIFNGQDSKQQTLNTTLSTIQQIIESRKTKPKSIRSYGLTMQSLPSELIGHLASYLKFKDYRSFSSVNRMIYIGSNSPNTLQRLNLRQVNDYSEILLAKYSHLKHLSMRLTAFGSCLLPSTGETVCNRLQQLVLDGNNQEAVDITHFMTQNVLNVDHVNHLKCT